MKTLILLIVSSLFLSSIPNNKEIDSIEKIMSHKIEKTVKMDELNKVNSRMPIIIVKRD